VASEQVREVPVRRHVFDSERPFSQVLDGIFGGISQPDIGMMFSKLAASTSYREFGSLVRQAQGSADAGAAVSAPVAGRYAARRGRDLIASGLLLMLVGFLGTALAAAGSAFFSALRGHGSFADAYRNGIFVTAGLTAAALLLALIDRHRGRRARDETV
jgi:MFS family permease